ncbi:3-keto-disaccharide hydrolase [Spirosoma spitsbergense]|uniref:3-keto-disaccharide hydrolase n=1 Tax=Spirosoma spitsbergense TaxID=431554 RepID=UPI0003708F32|nr:DUF1080 domain-containing protein [Spirosoma spitsbergense]
MIKGLLPVCLLVFSGFIDSSAPPVTLFDGRTFRGWAGDTVNTWRIQDGALVGGSLEKQVPYNDFLCTTRSYANFELTLQWKLVGTGFVNGGVQLRSQRLTDPAYEMTGYQADLGNGYWGSLYDESRRNKTLVAPDSSLIKRILRLNEWNDYRIQCEGPRIRLWLNGQQTVDYVETDPEIPRSGLIGLQIHGGGKAEASYKNIVLRELP